MSRTKIVAMTKFALLEKIQYNKQLDNVVKPIYDR